MDKPQIIAHVQKSVNYTLFDTKWIPCSAKFIVLGNHARGTGAFQVYEVSHGDIKLINDVSFYLSKFSFKLLQNISITLSLNNITNLL